MAKKPDHLTKMPPPVTHTVRGIYRITEVPRISGGSMSYVFDPSGTMVASFADNAKAHLWAEENQPKRPLSIHLPFQGEFENEEAAIVRFVEWIKENQVVTIDVHESTGCMARDIGDTPFKTWQVNLVTGEMRGPL